MRAVRRWNKAAATAIGLAAGIVIVGSLGGCYTRVVSARGFGADQYEVSEPYQENSKLDNWVFGERPQRANHSRLKSDDNK